MTGEHFASFEWLLDRVETRVRLHHMRPWIRRGIRARRAAAEARAIPPHASWDVERQAKANTAAYLAHAHEIALDEARAAANQRHERQRVYDELTAQLRDPGARAGVYFRLIDLYGLTVANHALALAEYQAPERMLGDQMPTSEWEAYQQSRAHLAQNTPWEQAWGAHNANAGNMLEELAANSYAAQVRVQNHRAASQAPRAHVQLDQLRKRPPGSDTYHDAKRYGLTWGDDD